MTKLESPTKAPRSSASSCESMSPGRAPCRSVDELTDMLCPICEDMCSCNGKTAELRVTPTTKPAKRTSAPLIPTSVKKQKVGKTTAKKSMKPLVKRITDGQKKVSIKTPSEGLSKAHARSHIPDTSAPSNSDKEKTRREDLDAQFALSEYYFSDEDEEDEEFEGEEGYDVECLSDYNAYDDSDALAEYYGYTSGSDIAIESLFIGTSDESSEEVDSDDSEPDFIVDASGSLLFKSVDIPNGEIKHEESLSEQLAKITPQILAAISVAAKNLVSQSQSSSMVIPKTFYYDERDQDEYTDTALRLDELMDTKKLSMILSTSPPCRENLMMPVNSRRTVPMDAFRRSRRNSIHQLQNTNFAGALRSNSLANCTLAAAPSPDEMAERLRATWTISEPRRRAKSVAIQPEAETFTLDVEFEFEETIADDESDALTDEPIDTELFTSSWTMPHLI